MKMTTPNTTFLRWIADLLPTIVLEQAKSIATEHAVEDPAVHAILFTIIDGKSLVDRVTSDLAASLETHASTDYDWPSRIVASGEEQFRNEVGVDARILLLTRLLTVGRALRRSVI